MYWLNFFGGHCRNLWWIVDDSRDWQNVGNFERLNLMQKGGRLMGMDNVPYWH